MSKCKFSLNFSNKVDGDLADVNAQAGEIFAADMDRGQKELVRQN